MFKNLYVGELKKLFSLKTALIMFAVFVLGFIVVGLSFRAIGNLVEVEGEFPPQVAEQSNTKINVSEEDANRILALLKHELSVAEAEKKETGYAYYMSLLNPMDKIYNNKSQIAIFEYIVDNKLYDTDVYFYDAMFYTVNSLGNQTATSYATTMLSVFAFLLSVYALIIGSGAFANEMRNGTLKILLLNPITRNQLTLAKLLAMLTILTGAVMTVFLCITAYSYIAFDDPKQTMLFVFNASAVFKAGYSFPLFLGWMSLMLSTLSFGIMAFFFGTLTRKRVLGFVLPYVINVAASLIAMIGLARFWITNVVNFSSFFGIGMGLAAGSNFFISLPLAIVYFGGMIALSFILFNKRDVA